MRRVAKGDLQELRTSFLIFEKLERKFPFDSKNSRNRSLTATHLHLLFSLKYSLIFFQISLIIPQKPHHLIQNNNIYYKTPFNYTIFFYECQAGAPNLSIFCLKIKRKWKKRAENRSFSSVFIHFYQHLRRFFVLLLKFLGSFS